MVQLHPQSPGTTLEDTLQPITFTIYPGYVVEVVANVGILMECFTASSLSDPVFSATGSGAALVSMRVKTSPLPTGWSVGSVVGVELITYEPPPPEYPFPLDNLPEGATQGWLETWLGSVWVDFAIHPYVYHALYGWIGLHATEEGTYFISLSEGDKFWTYTLEGLYPWGYNLEAGQWQQIFTQN